MREIDKRNLRIPTRRRVVKTPAAIAFLETTRGRRDAETFKKHREAGAVRAWQVMKAEKAARELEREFSDYSREVDAHDNYLIGAQGVDLDNGFHVVVKVLVDNDGCFGDCFGSYTFTDDREHGRRIGEAGIPCEGIEDGYRSRRQRQLAWYESAHCTFAERIGFARERGMSRDDARQYAIAELRAEQETFESLKAAGFICCCVELWRDDGNDGIEQVEDIDSLGGIEAEYLWGALLDNGAINSAKERAAEILAEESEQVADEMVAARPDMYVIEREV